MHTVRNSVLCSLVLFSFVPVFAGSKSTAFVFINGGYDETSNYSIHENDLVSFRDNLFSNSKKTTVFNAGGPGTPVLKILEDGSFERGSDGRIVTSASTMRGAEKATKNNIVNFFKDLSKKETPEALTVVWGDHGSTDGVALWDGSILGAKDVLSVYGRLPKSTMIRAIHLHCNSGAAMSGPLSVLPLGDKQKLKEELDKKYPSNVCGLSVSDSDEVGQYREWTKSGWDSDLKLKPLSLTKLKDRLLKDPNLYPSIMLTSDYFLRDLKNSLCSNTENKSNKNNSTEGSVCVGCASSSSLPLSKTVTDLKKDLCGFSSEIETTLDSFAIANRISDELGYVDSQVTREYIKTKFPDFYSQFKVSLEQADKIQQEIAQEQDEKKVNDLVKKLEAVRSDFPTRYVKYSLTLKRSREFNSFFTQTVDFNWIKARAEKVPFLHKLTQDPKNANYFRVRGLDGYKMELSRERDKLARQRAEAIESINRHRASLTKVLFSDPQLSSMKERYESIVKCQESALN